MKNLFICILLFAQLAAGIQKILIHLDYCFYHTHLSDSSSDYSYDTDHTCILDTPLSQHSSGSSEVRLASNLTDFDIPIYGAWSFITAAEIDLCSGYLSQPGCLYNASYWHPPNIA